MKTIYHTILVALLSLSINSSHAQFQKLSLNGDSAAVVLVERLINDLGGKEIWSRSGHLFIEQHGWFTDPTYAAIEKTWRNLRQPAQRMHIVGGPTETVFILTAEGGWIKRKEVVTTLDADRHKGMISGYFNGSYVMLTRFAKEDQLIKLRYEAPYKVIVLDQDDTELGWYEINEFGHILKWGRSLEDGGSLEYVYGPPRDFGNIRFPSWGAALDGSWRYTYKDVRLEYEPVTKDLITPPNGE